MRSSPCTIVNDVTMVFIIYKHEPSFIHVEVQNRIHSHMSTNNIKRANTAVSSSQGEAFAVLTAIVDRAVL